jgi:acyl phosphate:glycerol-3-phosphate acyltransferase
LNLLIAMVVSYLFGSFPTAYIFGKYMRGIDIRKHGSGNMGATNVFRVLGKGPGVMVLMIDIIKGVIPLTLVANFMMVTQVTDFLILAVAAVCGHNWTIFLGFKGGKGIATSCGVLIGLAIQVVVFRLVLAWVLVVWMLTFFVTAMVSAASIVAAVVLPVLMALTGQDVILTLLGVIFCVFVVLRHRANLRRILQGQEPVVPLPFHSSPKK